MPDAIRLRPIPKYLSLALVSLQQAIAYRVTTLFNVALTFIWVFILYYLWLAAFSERNVIGGFTWDEMRTYVVLAYGINALVGWRIGSQMMQTIRSGEILREMVRPMNYCAARLSSAAGFAVVEGAISLLICIVVGAVFLDIQPPASPLTTALFAISLLLGFVTKALIVFTVSLLTFWTLNGVGLMWAQQAIIAVLSGTLVPIALMPDWLRVTSELLPMRGIVSTPVTLYLGKATGSDALGLMALQIAWAIALWLFANWAWKRAFDSVEIQGG